MDTEPYPEDFSRTAYDLTVNGALMVLVGLDCGLGVPSAPYPRLMLTAHIQFVVNGMLSLLAAILVRLRLSEVSPASGAVVVIGHVLAWAVCLSEVAAAFWGAKRTLPIAASQAGAPGADSWQESLVTACHVIPAAVLIVAWFLLVLGAFRARGLARSS